MALGPIPAGRVRGLLECAVCLERYRSPKELDCQHSFCESPCLEQLLSPTTQTIQCPICRATQVVPGGDISRLKSNRTFQRRIASRTKTSQDELTDETKLTNSDSICGICDRTGLAAICIHCNREVCDICEEKHTNNLLADVYSLLIDEANSLLSTFPENAHQSEELRLQMDQLRTEMEATMGDAQSVLDVAVDREQKRVALQKMLGFCTDTRNTLDGKDISQGDLELLKKSFIDKLKYIQTVSASCHIAFDTGSSLLHTKDIRLGSEMKHSRILETTSIGTRKAAQAQRQTGRSSQTSNPDPTIDRKDSIEYYKTIRRPITTLRGTSSGGFYKLHSAVISPYNGDIAISDKGKHIVTLLDKEGNFKRNIGCFGSGEAEFNTPCGMDYTSRGNLLVADSLNHRIQVFNAEGNFMRTFSRRRRGASPLNTPTDVCYSKYENFYYVCDNGNSCIQWFNIKGGDIEPNRLVHMDFVKPVRIKYESYFNFFGVHHRYGFVYICGEQTNKCRRYTFMDGINGTTPLAFSDEYAFVNKPDSPDVTRIYHGRTDLIHQFSSAQVTRRQIPVIDLAVRRGRIVVVGANFIEIY